MISIKNVFKIIRRLREANLDIDKFTNHGTQATSDTKAKQGFHTMADVDKQLASKEQPHSGKQVGFEQISPQPRKGAGEMSTPRAKQLGLKVITGWYVNPTYWEMAKPNGHDAINWDGDDWIAPKHSLSRTFVKRIHYAGVRPKEVMKPDIWKKYFENEFGPQTHQEE